MRLTSIACQLAHKMLLSELGKQLFSDHNPQFMSKNLSGLIGYKQLTFNNSYQLCYDSYTQQLKQLSNEALGTYIEHNCMMLVDALNGDEIAAKVLYGIVLLQECNEFSSFFNHLVYDDCDSNTLFASALDLSLSELTDAVVWLTHTPLFESRAKDIINAQNLNPLISNRLVREPVDSYLELIEDVIEQLPPSHLTPDDFEYVEQVDLMQRLLSTATQEEIQGINVLIYGEVGVGKSELTKAVADSIGATLFKVHSNGSKLTNSKWTVNRPQPSYRVKLDYMQLIQQTLNRNQGTILICEECEDIFRDGFARSEFGKDSLNSVLEDNAIPVLYVTNHIDQVPTSAIRRMSMVVEVEVPDNRILKSISDDAFSGLRIRNSFKDKLVETSGITPAHLTNAAHVMRLTETSGQQAQVEIEKLVHSNLAAMGVETKPSTYKSQTPFNADYLNIKHQDVSYSELLRFVKQGVDVKALLLGSPGTGKTQLVHQLAKESNRPLVVKKASDILGKYVGDNERNIAKAFAEAKEKSAILFFDEFDSFMTSRESANASWQVTQVNEILVQMDQFDFPYFSASNTNTKILDAAAMRRFDFKLEFDFLKPEQLITLFCETMSIKQSQLSDSITKQLSVLNNVSLGDIAIVARRRRLSANKLTLEQAIQILASESDRKCPNPAIGFVH